MRTIYAVTNSGRGVGIRSPREEKVGFMEFTYCEGEPTGEIRVLDHLGRRAGFLLRRLERRGWMYGAYLGPFDEGDAVLLSVEETLDGALRVLFAERLPARFMRFRFASEGLVLR